MEAPVSHLLNRNDIWLASQQQAGGESRPTGFSSLDQQLALGGWPRYGVVELLADDPALSPLLVPLLAESDADRWLLCVAPPVPLYAPGWQQIGVDLSRLVCVDARDSQEQLWTLEQALSSGRCALVLAWLDNLSVAQVRRLQLAAERGRCLLMLHLPLALAEQPHPVPLRLSWSRQPGGLSVSLLKERGGWPKPAFFLPLCGQGVTLESEPCHAPVLLKGPW
ncbi:translesion DNA synthesis-associated protein ImuA [Ferrimonas balearica]|uniref:translesion DNA synthesis-associated protein ImuA n=1 Tax=Ferrimonas balearica TaxID=44012 RepID=UPI001F34A047|nr:translesion DNA synthesis-associated protein ImuA [Ferrimonas balearica]MBY6093214.1 translesion DNA synthesis-associated protein ImuA [Ferrimonas balearica]